MRAVAGGLVVAALLGTVAIAARPAVAEGTVGTAFPSDFPVIRDASLGVPVLGFGGAVRAGERGETGRVPVIFLHGNNDTPYPTNCNGAYGKPRAMAQHFADRGYRLAELWGLGYQGDQCDLLTDQTRRAGVAHSTAANVPDLRAFVHGVLEYTGARQVDIVGHSLGATLTREWLRQDRAYAKVRRVVSVDGPHHGIINCSPSPQNYYATIGFVPNSPVCVEYGAARTPFLTRLNADDETPGPTQYLAIVNVDSSFVYMAKQDGVLPPVPAQDRTGAAHDFSPSARLEGAATVELTGQGVHDLALLAAHTGIINSPDTWRAAFDFLTAAETTGAAGAGAAVDPADGASGALGSGASGPGALPATGPADDAVPALVAVTVAVALALRRVRVFARA